MALMYTFLLDQLLAYIVSNITMLEFGSEGPSHQLVALRQIS